MNRERSRDAGKQAGAGSDSNNCHAGRACMESRKPSEAGADMRLRRSAVVFRKQGTWSMCTEMCQKRWHKQKQESTWQSPRAIEMPFQDAESHEALSHLSEKCTGQWPTGKMRCNSHTSASCASSSQQAMKCWGIDDGDSQSQKSSSW